jgi:internalin A
LREGKKVAKHESPETVEFTRATGWSISQPINEAKLILVGQGSVGKTSLVQQIIHGTFDQNQTKTEGILLTKWQVRPLDKETAINTNIWDFGGQEIMHATHQFFLTKRSLYLLVLDARLGQNENRVEYWLRMIQSFGGDSPVIVVGNKIDQQPLDIDRRGLQSKYPNIKAFVETSCLDGRGIKVLRELITREIDDLKHVRDLLPGSWFQVKEKLENLDKDFIPYSEYEVLCNEGGITDETSQSTLIGFLHDLGSVLNFRDDPRLQETNILNPEWVTNGVYRILNSNELFQNKGVLKTKHLGQMLDPKDYPRARHMFIVDMMRKFELCYPFEGDDGKYLVPDLLPREEPFTGDWRDALAFEYHYTVLPSSIISRFIVRMHPYIYKNLVWRSGVMLNYEGNQIKVKADFEDKKIFIDIVGPENTRRDALSAIRSQMDSIHKTIPGLHVEQKVPLADHPEAEPVDYEFLRRMENEGRKLLPVQAGNNIIDVIVQEVLNRIEDKSKRTEVHIHGNVTDTQFIVGDDNQQTASK